jgi:hypothetical protein
VSFDSKPMAAPAESYQKTFLPMAGPTTTEELKDLTCSVDRTFKSMFVLTDGNDPWLPGNPARKGRAEWYVEIYERLDIKRGRASSPDTLHNDLAARADPQAKW